MCFNSREKFLLALVIVLALFILYTEDKKRKQQQKENLSLGEMLNTPLKDIKLT